MTARDCPAGDPADCPLEPNRRRDDPRWAQIHERMESFDKAMRDQAEALKANTTLTQEVKKNTEQIVDFFNAGRGFFTVVRFLGFVAVWITKVAAAAGIVWVLWKYGVSAALDEIRNGKP